MDSYNPQLAFSSHLPGAKAPADRSLTPKKKLNFPIRVIP